MSPTDSVAKLFAPGGTSRFDFMITNMYFVQVPLMGAKSGDERMRPFDMSKMTNVGDMIDLFKTQMQGQMRDGKTFMVPVYWGYDTAIFRTDKIPEDDPATKSWAILYDDRYAGRVALRDDAYQCIMTAALALGHKEPTTMPLSDLNEVKKFLISKKKNFRALWTKFGEAVNLISSGEVALMYGWMPMRAALLREGIPVASARPKEGLLFWTHAAFIPKDSSKAALAMEVANTMLSEEYSVALTNASNYGPISSKAMASYSPADQKRLGLDVTDGKTALLPEFWPDEMSAWIEAWAAFKSA
ncbi:ABC transporter substrate-binding protein [Rhodoplanes sp. Z2-YC6860]|uniref:ABC transporter substrate-binding protein n=1 Tax=Rhodoplanes sp. Z2-YC6860 TaxID=674703 RepID=UPI001F1AE72D|nr:extracellular solute-binding protein [Rhodoplanes sp. Z2-YC6860]